MNDNTIKGTRTEANLKAAFAGESQAFQRYQFFARTADAEGQTEIANLFRSTAKGETAHANGHIRFLQRVGDPATGQPIGSSEANLRSALAGETEEYTEMYPAMAKTAREEGFDEIADWFEVTAVAERAHAARFEKLLAALAPGVANANG